jgi:hypothetical protein
MCGPIDSELMIYAEMLIKFTSEARQRGGLVSGCGYKPACKVCSAILNYLAMYNDTTTGTIARSLLKAGENTTINQDPCNETVLAFEFLVGKNKSPEAKNAFERHMTYSGD